MAKYTGYKRPKNTKKALAELLRYMGYHKWLLLVVAALVFISTGASVAGTYLLKPVINDFILPGDIKGLILALLGMGVMYLCGALSTLGYNRLMVKTSQKVVGDIRRDLFAHVQKLPLKYFDANTHGELMSRFTNDVDTVQEALNNSFTMVIQSSLTLAGTVIMLLVLNVNMALIVICFCLSCSALSGGTEREARNIMTGSRRTWRQSMDLRRKWWQGRRWRRSSTMKKRI